MDAQGALDSLLGRLTTILVEEAQLLGRVRGDVEFIKEEMECMNSLILQITDAEHRDHLVQAWMKQVIGLTRDCEGNVEHYIHYVGSRPGDNGFLGHLRRVMRFLRTIPARHQIATRIRELKLHAKDIGDRRQRYGVTVPASASATAGMNGVEFDAEPTREKEDLRQRTVLLDAAETGEEVDEVVLSRGIDTLVKWLSTEPTMQDPRVRVFSVLGTELADKVAKEIYQQHYSCVASIFGCKAWCDKTGVGRVLTEILEQVGGAELQPGQEEDEVEDTEKQLISKIQGHLKDKCFLIVVITRWEWKRILDALLQAADGCLPGSAIIMTTADHKLALSSCPYKIIHARSTTDFHLDIGEKLQGDSFTDHWGKHFISRLRVCSAFARKMLLHLVYVNYKIGYKCYYEITKWVEQNKSVDQNLVMQSYSELRSKYRSCLLYLTIFPKGHVIKTSSLARRWIAEGLIPTTTQSDETNTAVDETKQYWDVLFAGGFISPLEISPEGNIKSCTLHHEVHKVIVKIARDVNIVDTNLPTYMARHLSIHNRIVLLKSHSGADRKDIAASLSSLAESSQWKLLKVLDLEGCQGLEKQHLKSICKILLLKYLSLRNTDVTELPKQIKELQCLETLDVRQTKVQVLAKKATVLPLLRHFLAGHRVSAANDSTRSEDLLSAVQMPLCIEKMNNMEILSHVRISNSKELAGITELLKLRKLGVALQGKHIKLSDLFVQIEKLHRCLRSLSIRIQTQGGSNVGMLDPFHLTPLFIERLNISGITCGLRHLIQEHHKLTKITLCMTHLMEDDLTILGKLGALRCLRLQHNSYTTECKIGFTGDQFQSLDYLLVQGKDITKISFSSGAAPKLERIVWCFARMDAVSGLNHLSKLKKLELNGDCNLDPIEQELLRHRNLPELKHKPQHQRQEDRTAASTSSSSAP